MKIYSGISRLLAVVLITMAPLVSLRAIEVRFLNTDGEEHSLGFMNKGEKVAVSADENLISPAYVFESGGPLVLFKEAVTEGKKVRVTAASLDIPAGLTHVLVVLSATDRSSATYSGLVIDDSPSIRPAGTILLLNRSRYPLSFRLDAEVFTLAPQGVRQMSFSQDINRIVVQADAEVDGKWQRVFGNPLPVRAGVRVLLLLRDGRPQVGNKTNLVDMLSFYDRPPVAADAAMPANQ